MAENVSELCSAIGRRGEHTGDELRYLGTEISMQSVKGAAGSLFAAEV